MGNFGHSVGGVKLVVLATDRQPLVVARMLLNMLAFWSGLPVSNILNQNSMQLFRDAAA